MPSVVYTNQTVEELNALLEGSRFQVDVVNGQMRLIAQGGYKPLQPGMTINY